MGLVNGIVELQNNYSKWKEMFFKEKKTLRELFNDIAITIEHVGSTAVENLAAKPIVDIVVGVNNLDDVNQIIGRLKENYIIKKNNDIHEILLIKENNLETLFLIHVLDINSERYNSMIIFRDILIKNPTIREEYERLKSELKEKYSDNREMYTKSKHDFIENVINKRNF